MNFIKSLLTVFGILISFVLFLILTFKIIDTVLPRTNHIAENKAAYSVWIKMTGNTNSLSFEEWNVARKYGILNRGY